MTGGPIMAIRGLCGGAGASTLTYLLAAAAARQHTDGTVLACDATGQPAGLALYAGARSRHSLPGLAAAIAHGQVRPQDTFAVTQAGLRLIASTTPDPDPGRPDDLDRVLDDARHAHVATFVDCGTAAHPAAQRVIATASHVVWALPASATGVARAQLALTDVALPDCRQEVMVARRDRDGASAATRRLAELADGRAAPLVLMPAVDLLTVSLDTALDAAQIPIAAILDRVAGIRRD